MEIPLLTMTQDASVGADARRLAEETFGLIYWANTQLGDIADLMYEEHPWFLVFQQRLFQCGHDIHLATANITAKDVSAMRSIRHHYEQSISSLHNFILPGGVRTATRLQEAAAILMQSRRLFGRLSRLIPVNGHIAEFLDEASSACFCVARVLNYRAGYREIPWNPNAQWPPVETLFQTSNP